MTTSADAVVGFKRVTEAKLRLMQARAAGVNPRDVRTTLEWAAKEAENESAAWATRAAGFREVINMIDDANDQVEFQEGSEV